MMTALRQIALRSSSASVRPSSTARRALMVRGFQQEHGKERKHQKQEQEQASSSSNVPAPTSQAPQAMTQSRDAIPLQMLPFRRMSDAMLQMQREMDSLLGQFDDPFFSPSPLLGRRALSPFSLLDSLTSAPSTDMAGPPAIALARALSPMTRMVPVEVQEDDKSVTITAEVPGFAKDHIKVEVDPALNLLTISGDRSSDAGTDGQPAGQEGAQAGGQENKGTPEARSFMSFTRSFTLPPNVDLEHDIKASAEHGILKVVLPKAPHKEPASTVRQIPIA